MENQKEKTVYVTTIQENPNPTPTKIICTITIDPEYWAYTKYLDVHDISYSLQKKASSIREQLLMIVKEDGYQVDPLWVTTNTELIEKPKEELRK